jgi:tetratricopeptide (TPR) repeat protein
MDRAHYRPTSRTSLLAGLVLVWAAGPSGAASRFEAHTPMCVQPRGAEVGTALLLEYYNELPTLREGDNPKVHLQRLQTALEAFKKKVAERYTEGTLQRLLDSANPPTRRATVLVLGLLGTMASNEAVAGRLHDDDPVVRQLAADALWALWFRADSDANNQELQRLMQLRDRDPNKALAGLDALVRKAPNFAEAYNQRAILYFQKKDYEKSAADCERVVQLNPVHFGAYAGMAQCYLALEKPRAALKAFRKALQIKPDMEDVEDAIRALENALGGEGRKDDKK